MDTDSVAITARGEFRNGLKLVLPVTPGTAAWGLVAGVAMVRAGLGVPEALAMTLLMYAGSAQLACMPLIAADAPLPVILLTAAMVNLRFLIYGIGLAPAFRHETPGRRLFLGFFNTDAGFVLFLPRYLEDPTRPHLQSLYLGIASGNWAAWQSFSFVGIALAASIPPEWGLDLAGPLALIALAIPLLDSMPAAAGAIVAGAVAVLGAAWPMRLGLIAAIVVGVAAATFAATLTEKTRGLRP